MWILFLYLNFLGQFLKWNEKVLEFSSEISQARKTGKFFWIFSIRTQKHLVSISDNNGTTEKLFGKSLQFWESRSFISTNQTNVS